MIRAASAALLFAATMVAADMGDADAELKSLEGKWVIAGAHLGGRDHLDDFAGMKLILKGNQFTIAFAENSDKGTFRLDPAKSPKWIDIKTGAKGPFFGRTLLGIYKLEKGQLILCCEADGKTRPTAFEAKEKSRNMLLTYKRETK
jgi:uncharacterized protein (TIGR03067 family)